jgi:hypothetical protein
LITEQSGQNGPAELSVWESPDQQLSFETLLDEMCGRLQDTRQQGSLKHIRKLEDLLDELGKELDELLASQAGSVSE